MDIDPSFQCDLETQLSRPLETTAKKMAPACIAAPEPLVPPQGHEGVSEERSLGNLSPLRRLHQAKGSSQSASPEPAAGRVCRHTRISEEEEMAKKSSRGRNQDRASRFGGMARFSVLAVAT
jgi:hypothetical protein